MLGTKNILGGKHGAPSRETWPLELVSQLVWVQLEVLTMALHVVEYLVACLRQVKVLAFFDTKIALTLDIFRVRSGDKIDMSRAWWRRLDIYMNKTERFIEKTFHGCDRENREKADENDQG